MEKKPLTNYLKFRCDNYFGHVGTWNSRTNPTYKIFDKVFLSRQFEDIKLNLSVLYSSFPLSDINGTFR